MKQTSQQCVSFKMTAQMKPGALLESLDSWMPDYVIHSFPPQSNITRQPVFSARFANYCRLKRSESLDSIITQISLLSCSSYGKKVTKGSKPHRRGRKKSKKSAEQLNESIWVRLASKRTGIWDKMFKNQTIHPHMETESEIFKCLSDEEKRLVVNAGLKRNFFRKRCNSNARQAECSKKIPRRNSAFGRLDCGKILRPSKLNIKSKSEQHGKNIDGKSESHIESVWHEETENFDLDHKRELSVKVKNELRATTSALRKVTGYGGDISCRPLFRPLEDFPHLVAEDFSRIAKFPHSMKISPHLSRVIYSDVAVRMGRPRYHEIRMRDLEIWNRGHALDRAHRNLKVFNWLHSLKESDFDLHISHTVDIEDQPQDDNIGLAVDEIVQSVDEPITRQLLTKRVPKGNYVTPY